MELLRNFVERRLEPVLHVVASADGPRTYMEISAGVVKNADVGTARPLPLATATTCGCLPLKLSWHLMPTVLLHRVSSVLHPDSDLATELVQLI